MKKIIAVLSLALLLQNIIFFDVFVSAETSGIGEDEKITLGCDSLFEYYHIVDESILADNVITRGEFANVVCNLLEAGNINIKSDTQYLLADVDENTDYSGDIFQMITCGYMSAEQTDGKYYFYPDSQMGYADAVKTLLCLLGYADCIHHSEEYNLKIAKDILLIKASDSAFLELLPNRMKNLIFRMLCSDVVYSVSPDKKNGFRSTGKTFLESYLNMYYVDGILESSSLIDIYGREPLKGNRVRLEGEIFTSNLSVENYEYIGNYIRAFIVDNTEKGILDEVVSMTLYENRNAGALLEETWELACSRDFTSIRSDGDKRITYEIDKDANIFYNFTYLGHIGAIDGSRSEVEEIFNKIGTRSSMEIALKDTDNDGDYDFVWFRDLTDVVLKKFDFAQCKLVTDQDISYLMDKAYYNFSFVSINDDGSVFNPKDFAKNDVLSMFYETNTQNKITRVVMYVSKKSITGEITENGSDGYGIGGEAYRTAKGYEDKTASGHINAPKLDIGVSGKFFLNKFGDICGCDTSAAISSRKVYGFLTRAQKEEKLSGGALVEIYTAAGDKVYLPLADKCKINGVRTKKDTVFQLLYDRYKKDFTSPTAITIYSLVKYIVSDKEIIEIEIAVNEEQDDLLYPEISIDSATSSMADMFYKSETIGRRVGLSDQTVIFSVPTLQSYSDSLEDDMAIIINPTMYIDCAFGVSDTKSQGVAAANELKMEFYDLDSTRYAGAAIRYYKYVGASLSGSLPDPGPLASTFTISKIYEGINESGENVFVFYGYDGYVEKRLLSVPIKDENNPWEQFTSVDEYNFERKGTLEKFKLDDIRSGDVVSFYLTTKSEVLNILPLVRGGTSESMAWAAGHVGNVNIGIGFGTVVAVDGGHLLVHELDGVYRVYSVTAGDDIVMYNRQKQSVYLSNTSEIEVGMDICFKSYYSQVRNITVFEN